MTHKRVFGDWDWIEVKTDPHHKFAMFSVAGMGIAWKCHNDMPKKCTFKKAVRFVENYKKEA
jgi:hypothetical protein